MSLSGSKNRRGGNAAGGASWRPICPNCNVEANVFTSHTAANPSRDFFKCPYYSKEGCQFWRWADSWEPKEEHAHAEEGQRQCCNWRGMEQKMEGVEETLQRHWKGIDQRMEGLEESLQRHWKAVDQRMEGFEQSLQRGWKGMEERVGRVEESMPRNWAEMERRVEAVQVLLSRLIKVAGVVVVLLLYLVLLL